MRGGLITGDLSLFRVSVTNRQTRVRPDCVQNVRDDKQLPFYGGCLCSWHAVLYTLQRQAACTEEVWAGWCREAKAFPASSSVISSGVACHLHQIRSWVYGGDISPIICPVFIEVRVSTKKTTCRFILNHLFEKKHVFVASCTVSGISWDGSEILLICVDWALGLINWFHQFEVIPVLVGRFS